MDDVYKVSLAKGEDCYETTRRCLRNICLGINANDNVFIKINLSTKRKPEEGMTTHPEVVEALADIIESVTRDITIIESDSSDPTSNADLNFEFCGFDYLLERGIKYVNLSKAERTLFSLDKTKILKDIEFASIMKDYDVLVNIPVLKTHSIVGTTLGVKNLFGLIPEKRKLVYHPHLIEVLYDVYCTFPSSLTIIDGMVGCEGWFGELFGNPVGMGVVIAGTNTIAILLLSCCRMRKSAIFSETSMSSTFFFSRWLTRSCRNLSVGTEALPGPKWRADLMTFSTVSSTEERELVEEKAQHPSTRALTPAPLMFCPPQEISSFLRMAEKRCSRNSRMSRKSA